jgi:hypothetical protein
VAVLLVVLAVVYINGRDHIGYFCPGDVAKYICRPGDIKKMQQTVTAVVDGFIGEPDIHCKSVLSQSPCGFQGLNCVAPNAGKQR